MGDWHISIQGVGCHHNKDYPADANRMARKFVEDLRAAGHTVTEATFTSGGKEALLEPPNMPWLYQDPANAPAAEAPAEPEEPTKP